MPDAAEIRARTGGRDVRGILYTAEDIGTAVARMGREITEAYPRDEEIVVIGLLKGSFIGDLVRHIERPVQVDFLVAASYGSGTESSGQVRLLYDGEAEMRGRHVIIVEDIVDSGTTLNWLVPRIREREPASLELCALLHKNLAPALALEPRWVGFDAPDLFLIGYGLDHSENFRNLPFIAAL